MEGEGWQSLPAEGVSHAVVVLRFLYISHSPRAYAAGWRLCVEGCGVGFARRAVRKYVANSTAH